MKLLPARASRAAVRQPDWPFSRLQAALRLRPRRALSSAGAKSVFPVSVTAGVYREGKGNEWIVEVKLELVATVVVANEALFGELGQSVADGGGAQSAELAQTLHGDGFL